MRIFLIALVPASEIPKIPRASDNYAKNWDAIFGKKESPLSEITRGLTEGQTEQRELQMPEFKLKTPDEMARQRANLN